MEEKEVKNEDIKEEEKDKKNNPPKKWKKFLIIGVIVLLIIANGFCVWYFWIRDKKNDSKTEKSHYISEKNNEYIEFKSNIDNKIVKIYVDNMTNQYKVQIKGSRELLYKDREFNDLTLFENDNCWYIVNIQSKELIAYNEESNGLINYDIVYNGNEKCYIVYQEEKNANDFFRKKIIMIINSNKKILLSYQKDNPYYISSFENTNQILVKEDDKYFLWNIIDGIKKTLIKNICSYHNNEYLIEIYNVNQKDYVNFNYSIYEIDEYKIYKYDNEELIIYKIDNDYYGYYYNNLEFREIYVDLKYINNFEDDKYVTYSFSGSQCGNNILINKKTNSIEKTGSSLGFIKTNNGYYLKESECWTEGGPTSIYTNDWKLLGTLFKTKDFDDFEEQKNNSLDNDGNVYVYNNGYVIKYDVNGNELYKSNKFDEIGFGRIIGDKLYFISKKNNIIYLCNTNDNEMIEVIKDYSNELSDYMDFSYKDNVISITNTNTEVFEYNLNTKELKKLN